MAKKKVTNEKSAAGGQEIERCHWTSADESCLINYITTHKAKGGDGLNFNKNFWAQAANDVAHSTMTGAVKTPHACNQKWQRVCFFELPLSPSTNNFQDARHLLHC
jgi:hypothetical protein